MEENKGHQKDLERNVFDLSMILAKQLKENQKFTEPDYWEKLKHQYAGMAMQGILMNEKMMLDLHRAFGKDESMDVTVSDFAVDIAHTLIQKLKEKEERK